MVRACLAASLVLPLATVAFAQVHCEETFHDPSSGDPTTLEILIEEPAPGSVTRTSESDAACSGPARVAGIASSVGIPPRFDFYVVIDRSGSTSNGAGMDVDGSGRYDAGDTILAAEVLAAKQFVSALDMSLHRACVVEFDEDADVVQGLTDRRDLLEAALDRVRSRGPGGGTNYGVALETALGEHGHHDPARRQVILFLSDGEPTEHWHWPPGSYRCGGSPYACAGIVWSQEAAARGLVVDTFAVGLGADPTVLAEMARVSGGHSFALDVPGEIIDVLPNVIHVGVSGVLVRNATSGREELVLPSPDGRFEAAVPLVVGLNDIEVVAVSDHGEGWRTSCRTDATLADDVAPELRGVPGDERAACDAPPPLDPEALDACDPAVTLRLEETRVELGCPDSHDLLRRWIARDSSGNEAEATQRIQVRDEGAPILQGVPPDVTLSCAQEIPVPAVAATDDCDPAPRVELVERRDDGPCPGSFRLTRTWTTTDRCGHAAAATQVVDVVDDAAPLVVASADDRLRLWPPRHDLVTFTASDFHPAIIDGCGGTVRWSFVDCRSSQPDDGRGDGRTTQDCQVSADGQSLLVRSERTGHGGRAHVARTYVPVIVAIDACGNASPPTDVGLIHVPHDMKGREARARR